MFDEELKEHMNLFNKLHMAKQSVEALSNISLNTLEQGGKLIFAGNGGSAADAQHIATEFTVKFKEKRVALPAIALTTDTSALTAIGNDFGFDHVFARQLEALGKAGDTLVLISTSGQSRNIIECARAAKLRDIVTFGLLGKDGGQLKLECDNSLVIPHTVTSRIQEAHMFILHCLIDSVETRFLNGS